MAKWSPARWGGPPKPETLPDSAYAFVIKDKAGTTLIGGKAKGRRWVSTGLHRYTNFMQVVYAFWDVIDNIGWKQVGTHIEHEGVKIVEVIPYKSKWEFYRVKFNTPPALTNELHRFYICSPCQPPRTSQKPPASPIGSAIC